MKRTGGRAKRALVVAGVLSLPAGACSLTLDMDSLRQGCAKPLVDCNGECRSSCSGAAAGSESAAGGAGASTSNGGLPGNGGKAGVTGGGSSGSSNDQGGAAGAPTECMISYPFSYTPDPPGSVSAVHVSGSFTAWDEPGIAMTDDGQGTFRVSVDLPPGRHLYKFVLGDKPPYKWVYDPANPKKVSDTFLSYNSILDLECGVNYGSGGGAGAGGAGGAAGAGVGGE